MGLGWIVLTFEFITALVLSIALLCNFASRRTPWYTYAIVGFSWFLSFSTLLLLPLDISSALYKDCKGDGCGSPLNYVEDDALEEIWKTFYWTNFTLAWFVLSIMRMYVKSGGFTIWRKTFSVVKRMGIQYTIVIVIVFIVFLVLLFERSAVQSAGGWSALGGILIGLSNLYGMFMVFCLLGVGMVDVPRRLWLMGSYKGQMNAHKLKVAQLTQERDSNSDKLAEIIEKIYVACDMVPDGDGLHKYTDILLSEIPTDFEGRTSSLTSTAKTPKKITINYIENLRREMHLKAEFFERSEMHLSNIVERSFFIEDCLESRGNKKMRFERQFHSRKVGTFHDIMAVLEWWWLLVIRPIGARIVSLHLAAVSLMVLWSELTVVSERDPDLSLVSLIVRGVGHTVFVRQCFVFVFLGYIVLCVYFSLFKWKVLELHRMYGNRHTHPVSLMFNAYLIGRFNPALIYNFLVLLHMDSKGQTSYSHFYKSMDVVPLFGTDLFNYLFPFMLLLIVVCALFDVWGWVWNKVYRVAMEGSKEERMRDGEKIIAMEKKLKKGQQARDARAKDLEMSNFPRSDRMADKDSLKNRF